MMDDSALLWGSGGLFFVGLLLFIGGALLRFLILQKIENTPTSKIRSAAVGLVEVYGAVEKEDMKSPISGQKCVYWELMARPLNPITRDEGRNFYKMSSYGSFFIEDETGRATVDSKGAIISLPWNNRYDGWLNPEKAISMGEKLQTMAMERVFGSRVKRIDGRVTEFLKNADKVVRQKFMEHETEEIIVYERYIPTGSKIYVIGTAEKDGGVTTIKKGIGNALFISDKEEKKTVMNLERPMERWIYWGVFIGIIGLIGIVVSIL